MDEKRKTQVRESQYVETYLNMTGDKAVTVGTFLNGELSGKAKQYSSGYYRALISALCRRVESGEVVAVKSVRGSVSFKRVASLTAEERASLAKVTA